MKTSREVYNQIRWDPALNECAFTVGYRERKAGMKEVPFPDFNPETIPWDRVWWYKLGEVRVWDRAERIDRFGDHSIHATPGATRDSGLQPEPDLADAALSALSAWRYDASQTAWRETIAKDPPHRGAGPRALTVATYNVLFDLYPSETPDLSRRIPLLFDVLRELDADLLVLQEVTPPLLERLQQQDWLRERYNLSDGSPAKSVTPYGQLVLSRYPLRRVSLFSFTRDKKAVLAELEVDGSRLMVVALHLPSDRMRDAVVVRARQLQTLLSWSSDGGRSPDACLLLGDFNFDSEQETEVIESQRFGDVWKTLRSEKPGYTFDPSINHLAALSGRSGQSARYDRIFWRSGALVLHPQQAFLFGKGYPLRDAKGAGGVTFPSDHFGVCCRFRRHRDDQPPVYRSAVAVIPPEDVWQPIQARRRRHDKQVSRWMPHINLLYGFLAEEHFEQAAEKIAQVLTAFDPFVVSLSRLRSFSHRASHTIWLQPETDPPGKLHELQAALHDCFPQCAEQNEKSTWRFTPHLTVGQLPQDGSLSQTIEQWQSRWRALRFPVGEVCLISRRKNEPFVVRRRTPFAVLPYRSEPAISSLDSFLAAGGLIQNSTQRDIQRRLRQSLQQAWAECLQNHGVAQPCQTMFLIGSAYLQDCTADQDLDLLCIGTAALSRDEFFTRMFKGALRIFDTTGQELEWIRSVEDGPAPALRLSVDGVQADIQYACFPESISVCHPCALSAVEIEQFSAADQMALLAYLDGRALLDYLGEHRQVFRRVLPAVKTWAKMRGLDGSGFGYLGGFSWSLLTAWICRRHCPPNAQPEQVLPRLFSVLAEWDWRRFITFSPEGQGFVPRLTERMFVIAPAAPCRNSTRNLTRSTMRVLKKELARAARLCEKHLSTSGESLWSELISSKGLDFSWLLALRLDCGSPGELAACAGWVEGQFLSLLLSLEQIDGLRVRPLPALRRVHAKGFDADHAGGVFLCGIEHLRETPRLQAAGKAFVEQFESWTARPAKSRLATMLITRQQLQTEHSELDV